MWKFTQENISIQERWKFKPIEDICDALVGEIRDKKLTGKSLVTYEEKLSVALKLGFNLNVIVALGANDCLACVECPTINTRHIFTPHEYKELLDSKEHVVNSAQLDKLLNEGGVGKIDFGNAWVEGVFAEAQSFISLDVQFLYKLGIDTGGRLLAILFHETGHIVTYMIYCANTASVNQILQRNLTEAINPEAYMRKVKMQLLQAPGLNPKLLEDIHKTQNKYIFGWKLSKLMYEFHSSHATASIYDNTSAESMADNFVARCGYAVEMVESLVILHKYENVFKMPKVASYNLASSTFELIKHSLGHVFKHGVVGAAAGWFLAVIIVSIMMIIVIVNHALSMVADTTIQTETLRPESFLRYDVIFDRLQRVRQQVISKLKGTTNAHKLALILTELDMIDAYMPSKDKWAKYNIMQTWVAKMLFSNEREQIRLEQELEKVIANDLLIAAANNVVKLNSKLEK